MAQTRATQKPAGDLMAKKIELVASDANAGEVAHLEVLRQWLSARKRAQLLASDRTWNRGLGLAELLIV